MTLFNRQPPAHRPAPLAALAGQAARPARVRVSAHLSARVLLLMAVAGLAACAPPGASPPPAAAGAASATPARVASTPESPTTTIPKRPDRATSP